MGQQGEWEPIRTDLLDPIYPQFVADSRLIAFKSGQESAFDKVFRSK